LEGLEGDDRLEGRGGADTLLGGLGNDTYVLSGAEGLLIENANEGVDTVEASVSYTLTAHFENLTLTGSAAISGAGNSLDNEIRGNSAQNVLEGGAGHDTIYDGGGDDVVYGGDGDDRMRTTLAWEQNTYNGGAGIDTVDYSLQTYAGGRVYGGFSSNGGTFGAGGVWVDLGAGKAWRYRYGAQYYDGIPDKLVSIENAVGSNLRDYLQGDAGANRLEGLEGDDRLEGRGGADTLVGGVGNDTLVGGTGSDTYLFGRGDGADLIQDDAGDGALDVLRLAPDIAADQLWFSRVGNDLQVSVIGSDDKATMQNWYAGSQYQVETFESGDGKRLLNTQVDALVNAMAQFAPLASGQSSLPSHYQSTLSTTLAANWH
jgi:Ca2+-binding RTX toxin-like protein